MSSIVEQFRAFEDPEPIIEMYFWNCQKLASKMVRECAWIKDDEKLLARLREHSAVFVNSMQTVAPNMRGWLNIWASVSASLATLCASAKCR